MGRHSRKEPHERSVKQPKQYPLPVAAMRGKGPFAMRTGGYYYADENGALRKMPEWWKPETKEIA
jgi:hypothetical protein